VPKEKWLVEAQLAGDFIIQNATRALSPESAIAGVRRLEIDPDFDSSGRWTGLHKMTATLTLDNDSAERLAAHVVYDRARDLVDSMAALISLEVGRPVRVEGTPTAKYTFSSPEKTRVIMAASKTAQVAPPGVLRGDLLALDLDSKVRRVVRWWARGVAARDPVDKLLALNNALDLLSGMQVEAPGRTRRCRKCGHEEEIGPGLRERVVSFLTDTLGYGDEKAAAIYESRLDLAHARSGLTSEERRHYLMPCRLVTAAVREGLATRLGVSLPDVPSELPVLPETALLDLTLTDPNSEQGEHGASA